MNSKLITPVAALGGSGVVVNRTDGRPLPPSDVVRKLEAFDPDLSVRFSNGVRGWAVCRRWKDDDPRRALIQKGDIDPSSDYTILTFLPHDCSVADAFNYVVTQARHEAHDKEYWAKFITAMLDENEKQSDDIAAKATAELDDYIDAPMGFGRSELPRVASSQMDNRRPVDGAMAAAALLEAESALGRDATVADVPAIAERLAADVRYVTSTEMPPPATGHFEIPAHWKREDGAEWNPKRKRWILKGKIVAGVAPEEPVAP